MHSSIKMVALQLQTIFPKLKHLRKIKIKCFKMFDVPMNQILCSKAMFNKKWNLPLNPCTSYDLLISIL